VKTVLPDGGYTVSANERPMPLIDGLVGSHRLHISEEGEQHRQGCSVHLENLAYWIGGNGLPRSAELRSKSAELVEVPDKTVEVDG